MSLTKVLEYTENSEIYYTGNNLKRTGWASFPVEGECYLSIPEITFDHATENFKIELDLYVSENKYMDWNDIPRKQFLSSTTEYGLSMYSANFGARGYSFTPPAGWQQKDRWRHISIDFTAGGHFAINRYVDDVATLGFLSIGDGDYDWTFNCIGKYSASLSDPQRHTMRIKDLKFYREGTLERHYPLHENGNDIVGGQHSTSTNNVIFQTVYYLDHAEGEITGIPGFTQS